MPAAGAPPPGAAPAYLPEHASQDAAWAFAGLLALLVWLISKPGAAALARLDRVREFGMRAGNRLGPRVLRFGGVLLAVSLVGEGVELLVREALTPEPEAAKVDDASAPKT